MTQDSSRSTQPDVADVAPVRFLEDSPATQDAFGPHKRVADALAQLVEQEKGGKAIALIGPWGSGKSTVITLLKAKCEQRKNSGGTGGKDLAVFVFDAWAHEGDPLRRTFLEQVTSKLIDNGWADPRKWRELLQQLSHRHKFTTTKSRPQLSWVGALFAALLLLAPLGLTILNKAQSRRWSAIGLAIFAFPLIFLMLAWLSKKPWRKDSGERWTILGLLVTKTAEVTQTETLESPEPTSVEFQEWFQRLAGEALTPNRKLIIVLDNLDRIGSEDALKLWSSMRTFLDFSEGQPPHWADKLWTLVPFDDTGIGKLWESDQNTAQTFLDKTFQIRFTIPAPLLSDWRSFLSAQLKFVFPHHTENEAYVISRLYATLCADKKPPTPRDIKLFVNQIAAVHLACAERIALAHEALYVVVKLTDQNWTPTNPLPQPDRLQPYLGTEWREDLAALHFNVPKEKAFQVLFGDKVEKAIADGDSGLLASIKERPGVGYLVEQTLEQRLALWSKNEPHILGRVAFALAGADVPQTALWNNAWQRLSDEAANRDSWPFLDAKSGRGLSALMLRAANTDTTKHFLSSLKKVPTPQGEEAERIVSNWTDGLLEVLRGVLTLGHESILADFFETAGFGESPQEYIALLASSFELKDRNELWRYIRPGCSEDSVIDGLAESVRAGNADLRFERACSVMMFVDLGWDWDKLVGAIQTRLQQGATPLECGVGLRTLFRLEGTLPHARTSIQAIASSGWLFHHFQSAYQANVHDATASCLITAILFDSEASAGANPGLSPSGRSTYRAVASAPGAHQPITDSIISQVIELRLVKALLELRPKVNAPGPTIDAALKVIAEHEQPHVLLTNDLLAGHWTLLNQVLGEEIVHRLVDSSVEHAQLAEYLANSEFAINLSGLYRRVLKADRNRVFAQSATAALQQLPKEKWLDGIEHQPELITLVADFLNANIELDLGYHLRDALTEIADQALAGQPAGLTREQAECLFRALSADQRELITRHLRDEVIATDRDTSNLLSLFESPLTNCAILSEESDKLIREGCAHFFDRQVEAELTWLSKILRECPQILRQSRESSRKDLRERLKGLEKEELKPPVAEHLQTIRELLAHSKG